MKLIMSGHKKAIVYSVLIFLLIAGVISVSLFFKERWLWLDETLSYIFLSDPSFSHMQKAIVSNLDANPPLFFYIYWPISHLVNLDTMVLRIVSIVLFAVSIVLFFLYSSSLVKRKTSTFLIIITVISLTYLNYTLSTQIRSYVLLLLFGLLFVITDHKLIVNPKNYYILFFNFLFATALIFTHNFGAFYVAVSFSFFGVLFIWSKNRYHLYALASHILSVCVWLLLWFSNFQIQSQTGKPHTWIPPLTFFSFFRTVSELLPTISSQLERSIQILPIIKVLAVVVVFFYISVPKLKLGYKNFTEDKAFSFYVLSGYISFMTTGLSMIISLVYMSVFLSRYQWISHLLILYQIIYTYSIWSNKLKYPRLALNLVPVYVALLAAFIFYQNKKISIFPSGILSYLPQLDKRYPVFFESADYFFPIWHHKNVDAYYLLNWEAALAKDNMLNATVDHKMALSLREEYDVNKVVYVNELMQKRFAHFYVVDESSRKQFEPLIKGNKVKIIKVIPVGIEGHRILECVM